MMCAAKGRVEPKPFVSTKQPRVVLLMYSVIRRHSFVVGDCLLMAHLTYVQLPPLSELLPSFVRLSVDGGGLRPPLFTCNLACPPSASLCCRCPPSGMPLYLVRLLRRRGRGRQRATRHCTVIRGPGRFTRERGP